jgi:hypothetical protein
MKTLGNFSLTTKTGEKDLTQVFDGHSIQLVNVEPYPISGKKIVLSDYVATFAISKSTVLSPLKQFKSGIVFQNIACKQGRVSMVKTNYNSPACVTVSTSNKLQQRSWGNLV